MGLRLVEDVGQVAEDVDETRDARLIHGNFHLKSLKWERRDNGAGQRRARILAASGMGAGSNRDDRSRGGSRTTGDIQQRRENFPKAVTRRSWWPRPG